MGAVVCTWTLVVALLCGTSHAFFNNVRPANCFPTAPRYESCQDTIQNLKSLMEISQSMKPDSTNICPQCNSAISEEVIMKLVNALIFTATQNCGFTGKGNGGYPINNGGGVGGNAGYVSGGGNTGGLIGGNNVGYPGGAKSNDDPLLGINVGGKNTVGVDIAGQPILGVDVGSQSGSGSNGVQPARVPAMGGQNYNDPLLGVKVLDDNELLRVNLGKNKLVGVDLGPSRENGGTTYGTSQGVQPAGVPATGGQSSDDPLLGVKVLDDNELLSVNLGKNKLVGVDLGPSRDNGGTTYGTSQGGITPSATGPVGGVTNEVPGGVTNGLPVPAPSSSGGVTNPVTGVAPVGSPVNNAPISTSTATNQVAGGAQDLGKAGATNTVINQPITSVPSIAGGGATPGAGTAAVKPVNEVNSGNSSTEENKSTIVNVINKPTDAGKGVQ